MDLGICRQPRKAVPILNPLVRTDEIQETSPTIFLHSFHIKQNFGAHNDITVSSEVCVGRDNLCPRYIT